MIEGLQLSIPRRMALLRVSVTLAMLVSVLSGIGLWGGERDFPYAPGIEGFTLETPFDLLLSVLFLLLLGASIIFRWHRLILFGALLLAVTLVCSDLNRLQPWFYIYGSMLLVFVFYNGRVDDSNKFTSYFISLQIILASVYFFCGISQLNAYFIDSQFAGIIAPLKGMVSERQFMFFRRMGAVVPYVLIFTGLGLIISPIRYLAISVAVLLHLALLVLLFPSAYNHNYALWLSNLFFIVMLFLLFSGKTKQRYFSPSYLLQTPVFYLVMLFFVALPFTNQLGLWPDYLSSNFKSGKNKTVSFKIEAGLYKNLPLYQKSFCYPSGNFYVLDYKRWSDCELNAECYPETPVFNSIYTYLRAIEPRSVKETQLALAKGDNLLRKP